jgi:hypothetical protein
VAQQHLHASPVDIQKAPNRAEFKEQMISSFKTMRLAIKSRAFKVRIAYKKHQSTKNEHKLIFRKTDQKTP